MNKFKVGDKARINLPADPERYGQVVEIVRVVPHPDQWLTQYWYKSPLPYNFGDDEWLGAKYLDHAESVPTFTTIDEANEWLNNATTP